MISTQPSVDDLLGRLRAEQQQISVLRRGFVHGVPRPPLFVRLLLVLSVVMIGAVAWLIAVVGFRAVQVAELIRAKRAAEAVAASALPHGAELLQAGKFRTAILRHPQAAAQLYAEQGRELLARARAREAVAAFAAARQRAVTALPGAALVDEIEALIAAGRPVEARRRLLELDLATCPQPDRERAVGMILTLNQATTESPTSPAEPDQGSTLPAKNSAGTPQILE